MPIFAVNIFSSFEYEHNIWTTFSIQLSKVDVEMPKQICAKDIHFRAIGVCFKIPRNKNQKLGSFSSTHKFMMLTF